MIQDDTRPIKEVMVSLMPTLRAFARSLCANETRADDLVQETLLKALTHIDSFDPGSNLRAWLFTILRNTFFSELRKTKREVEDVDGVHAEQLSEAPRQPGAVDLEDFKIAFASLHQEHREVLTLVGLVGMSYEEAAEVCGCAVGTVKSRVSRARRRLGELMGSSADVDAPPSTKR